MSVTDPLIKDLKGCIQQMFLQQSNSNQPIQDNDFYLVLFCTTIEKIFQKGLIQQQTSLYLIRQIDPYTWMSNIAKENSSRITFPYRNCVDNVEECADLHTNEARFRLLLKYCLIKQCLHVPTEFIIKTHTVFLYYKSDSIIGDEILGEIFLSAILQVSKMKFKLNVNNVSFLNNCWYIPELIRIELVPCKNLGLSISFAKNRAVIVAIESNSVVSEHGKIYIGDVLDKLNGTQIDSSVKGRLSSILRKKAGQPINLIIAKAYNSEMKEFYQPIKSLLIELKLDLDFVVKQYSRNSNAETDLMKKRSNTDFQVTYLGCIDVGSDGNVKQVQKAIKKLFKMPVNDIKCDNFTIINKVKQCVGIEVGEIGVKVKNIETNNLIMEHSYMQISSCGSLPSMEGTFAYIAGEENCDIAKNFVCYVFEANLHEISDTVLYSLVQGFRRTHFAV